MKITIEPRKTTWVPFIDSQAQLEVEWRCRVEHSDWSIHRSTDHLAQMRYRLSGLEGAQFIPSSKLIIKEQGIPLVITETTVSSAKDRFESEWIEDPFLEIHDRLAGLKKSEVTTRKLSKRMIERAWSESIGRSVKIQNKTGRKVKLVLTVVDQPAQDIEFIESTPAPSSQESPEFVYELALEPDDELGIKQSFRMNRVERIELPPDQQAVLSRVVEQAQEAQVQEPDLGTVIQQLVEAEVTE